MTACSLSQDIADVEPLLEPVRRLSQHVFVTSVNEVLVDGFAVKHEERVIFVRIEYRINVPRDCLVRAWCHGKQILELYSPLGTPASADVRRIERPDL